MQIVATFAEFCAGYNMDHFLAPLRILEHVCHVKGRKFTFEGGHESSLPADQAWLTLYSSSDRAAYEVISPTTPLWRMDYVCVMLAMLAMLAIGQRHLSYMQGRARLFNSDKYCY